MAKVGTAGKQERLEGLERFPRFADSTGTCRLFFLQSCGGNMLVINNSKQMAAKLIGKRM
jgi:hypothetical protein